MVITAIDTQEGRRVRFRPYRGLLPPGQGLLSFSRTRSLTACDGTSCYVHLGTGCRNAKLVSAECSSGYRVLGAPRQGIGYHREWIAASATEG